MFNFNQLRRAFRASKYGKIALIVLFVGLIAAAGSFAGSLQPNGSADVALATTLTCSGPDNAQINTPVTFTARGGTGTYSWNLDPGAPSNATFTKSFPNKGTKTVTVTSGAQSADCVIHILDGTSGGGTTPGTQALAVTCVGSPTNPQLGQTVTWRATATGGSGSYTYSWTGNGSFPTGATGNPVTAVYLGGTGQKNANVTVTSGTQTATGSCSVTVVSSGGGGTPAPQPLAVSCSASPSSPKVGDTVTWRATATGGSGSYTYSWTGNGSFPTGATGNPVTAVYAGGPGQKNANVTVTSGTQTITGSCSVVVQNADGTTCQSLQYTDISLGGNTASVQVTNPNPASATNCAQNVGLISYNTPVPYNGDSNRPQFISSQTVRDSRIVSVPAGTNNMTLSVAIPACEFQVDFVQFKSGQSTFVPSAAQIDALAVNLLKFKVSSGIATQPGRECAVPQPPQLSCTPNLGSTQVGGRISFTAHGGTGTYTWDSAGGSPATGNTNPLVVEYDSIGTKITKVTSGSQTVTCPVTILQTSSNPQAPVCDPKSQPAKVGDPVTIHASAGNGFFFWNAVEGNPSSDSGSTFVTHFSSPGPKTVKVTSDGLTDTCTVNVQQQTANDLSCSTLTPNVDVDGTASFRASGGDGAFFWTASGGSPSVSSDSSQSSFHTSYGSTGTKHVLVSDNSGHQAQCDVQVSEVVQNDLSCSVSDQTPDINDFVTFTADGGSGGYRWTANDGDPSSDTGRRFTTQFDNDGRFTVQVRDSDGNSATCRVNVQSNFSPRGPRCSPSNPDVNVGESVTLFANGGTGNFEWTARQGQRRSGFGSRFTTSFDSPGQYDVKLDSNGDTDTCTVNVRQASSNSLQCSPSNPNVSVNDFVIFSATPGNNSYLWTTASDGIPNTASGNANSFGTRFSTPGTKFVTVTSNGDTANCVVQIGAVLGASTVVTGPEGTAAAAAGLGFVGAMGAYGAVFRKSSKKILSKVVGLIRR